MSLTSETGRIAALGTAAWLVCFTTGCSDPAEPPPQGGASMMFAGGAQCTAFPKEFSIGSASSVHKTLLTDGDGGAQVSCSVKASGSGYAVSARLALDTRLLTFSGTTSKDMTNSAKVSARATELFEPGSTGQPCEVEVNEIGEGRAWLGFTCTGLVAAGSPHTCDIRDGWLAIENCD